MNSLELTTFKNIFNRLSVETQESFIKEIRYGIYYDMIDEMGKLFLSDLNIETKESILNLIKKSDNILKAISQNCIVEQMRKYGLVFKLTNELIISKDSKIRTFKYIDNEIRNEIYICISPNNLINTIDENNIKWLDDWKPYSLVLMPLNISQWKFQSTNGKMTSIGEEFIKMRVFDIL